MQNQEKLSLAEKASNGSDEHTNYRDRLNMSVIQTSELELWDNLKAGDENALGEIYNLHIEDLFSYGIHLVQDRSIVMDCIHDLFVDLFKYRNNLSIKGNAKYYLYLSLKRNIYRKNRRLTVTFSEEHDCLFSDSKKYSINSHEDTIMNNECRSEQVEKLSTALNNLTIKQKESIHLKYIQERTYEEISVIMGVSIQTARTTIYRALKSLRKSNL